MMLLHDIMLHNQNRLVKDSEQVCFNAIISVLFCFENNGGEWQTEMGGRELFAFLQ